MRPIRNNEEMTQDKANLLTHSTRIRSFLFLSHTDRWQVSYQV